MDITQEIHLYPIEDKFIAFLDIPNTKSSSNIANSSVETVVILDRSGSMGGAVPYIVNYILPRFFKLLSYDPETIINLITFESKAQVFKIKVQYFGNIPIFCGGQTFMAPAVFGLHKIFESFQSNVTSLRILTISDGEVFDQQETSNCGSALAEYAGKCNISVNSQAVRFFTSRAQPDTTALCSLLQLNNIGNCRLIDIQAGMSHDVIVKEIADLFINDGLDQQSLLKCNEAIYYKFPWDKDPSNKLIVLSGKQNIFWIDELPTESQKITLNGQHVKVVVQKHMNFDQLMLSSQLNLIIDRMKILKIVNTESAKQTIGKMIEYFTKFENILFKLAADVDLDPKSITDRARLLKLKMIMSRKLTTFLQTIANDDEVNKLNSEQKANYLRSIHVSSKAGRGLAKRAAKKKSKNWADRLNFNEIVHREVRTFYCVEFGLKFGT